MTKKWKPALNKDVRTIVTCCRGIRMGFAVEQRKTTKAEQKAGKAPWENRCANGCEDPVGRVIVKHTKRKAA